MEYPKNAVTQSGVPAAPKGTLEALIQRASHLANVAAECANSAADLEDLVIGHRQPKANPATSGSQAPKAVASGHIAKMDEGLDAIESFLERLGGSLEHLHSKR